MANDPYQALFDATLNGTPESSSGTDYAALFTKVLSQTGKAVFPEASLIKEGYDYLEPKVRPVVQAPVTGIGGLIALGQGKGLSTAAQGIREGKTAGDYVTEAIPEPTSQSVPLNIAGNIGRATLGEITDAGIMTGAIEGVVNPPGPKININLDAKIPAERPGLPRPYDYETEIVPESKPVFTSQTKSPVNYQKVFEEQLAPKETLSKDYLDNFHLKPAVKSGEDIYQGDSHKVAGQIAKKQGALYKAGDHEAANALAKTEKGFVDQNGKFLTLEDAQPIINKLDRNPFEAPKVAVNAESGKIINPAEGLAKVSEAFDTSGQYSPIAEAKSERFGNIQERNFTDEESIRAIEKGLSPEENKALMFMDGGKVPRQMAATAEGIKLQELIDKPTPLMEEAKTRLKAFTDQAHEELSPIFDKMGYQENYIPQIWDLEKAPSDVKGKFGVNNPFTKERTIPSLAQGIEAGLTPKFDNIGDTLRTYSRYKNQSVANNEFLTKVSRLKTPEGSPLLVRKSIWDPKTGVKLDNPNIPVSFKDGGSITPLLNGYAMSPEIAGELKFMAGIKNMPGEAQFAAVNAGLKKAALSLSFFHHITLTEGAIGLGVNPLKAMAKIPESFKVGGAAHLIPELSKDALKHGLTLGGVSDVEKGLMHKVAEFADQAIEAATLKLAGKEVDSTLMQSVLKPAIRAEELWDKTLWSAYHPLIKLMAYETNVATALKRFPKMKPELVKRQIAEVINNAAGGQPWELLFNNQEWQHVFRNALLALDWTASNIRIAENAFEHGPKGFTARKYWMKQVLLFVGASATLNYLNSQIQTGKGRFLWENDPDHKFDVWLYKDQKGRNYYMQLNKALIEPFRWLADPLKVLAHKLSPAMQIGIEQLTGHSTTGFDLDFPRPGNRLKSVADKVVPFSMSGNSLAGAWPIVSGMSYTKFKEEMETAVYRRDQKKINQLLKTAANNGIPAGKLYKEIRGKIKSTAKFEARQKNQPGPTALLMKKLTGFTIGDLVGSQLQSLRDKLKNSNGKN